MGFYPGLREPPAHPLRPMIPDNAHHLRITAGWHVVSRGFLAGYRPAPGISLRSLSSPATELYSPNPSSLTGIAGQGFPHCRKFPTAASRRSLAMSRPNVAVRPLRPAMHRRLGRPLPRQLANAPQTHPLAAPSGLSRRGSALLLPSGISLRFQRLSRAGGRLSTCSHPFRPTEVR